MTNDKFVQWLSGFCAAVEGTPTQKQWDIILKVLKEISEDKGIMQATPYISPEDKKMLFNTIISDKNITTK